MEACSGITNLIRLQKDVLCDGGGSADKEQPQLTYLFIGSPFTSREQEDCLRDQLASMDERINLFVANLDGLQRSHSGGILAVFSESPKVVMHALDEEISFSTETLHLRANPWDLSSYLTEEVLTSMRDHMKTINAAKKFQTAQPECDTCIDLLVRAEAILYQLIDFTLNSKILLAKEGTEYFLDTLQELYNTDIPKRTKYRISYDLNNLRCGLAGAWGDFQTALLTSRFMLRSESLPRSMVYANTGLSYAILEAMVRHDSYRVTHCAHSNGNWDGGSGSDLTEILKKIPLEEYPLLLTPLDRAPSTTDNDPAHLGSSAFQCADFSDFPAGFA